jgi:hypothetical protein
MKTFVRAVFGAICAAVAFCAPADVTRFDAATGLVIIPSVQVGPDTYVDVRLQHRGSYVFDLAGATPGQAGSPGVGRYDLGSGVLSLPAVRVGADTYVDVTLQNHGNFVFSLIGASELPAQVRSGVDAHFDAFDALYATSVPDTGAKRVSLNDKCWRHDGRTRDTFASDWEALLLPYIESEVYKVGRRTTNRQVVAIRNRTNPDGSTRQEVDVEYDEQYRDGSSAVGQRTTLIGGSSLGTFRCPSAQAEARLRDYGNQQLVQTGVRSRNIREERYSIADGTPLSPPVRYIRSIQWLIADPEGTSTYVILSGPGPAATVGGSSVPFSLKFISPRLISSAPELQGRTGNFVNMGAGEAFRFCGGGSIPVASIADCHAQGAVSNAFGFPTATPNAAADTTFLSLGWVTGGWYRFDVYDDDGWKTVNGHAGRTPIATYWDRSTSLGFTFAETAGGGPTSDPFPRISFPGKTIVQVRDNVLSASPAPEAVRWSGWLTGFNAYRLDHGSETHVGPRTGNAAGVAYPGYRSINDNFPGAMADGNVRWIVTPTVPGQNGKTYADFALTLSNRNKSDVVSTLLFQ